MHESSLQQSEQLSIADDKQLVKMSPNLDLDYLRSYLTSETNINMERMFKFFYQKYVNLESQNAKLKTKLHQNEAKNNILKQEPVEKKSESSTTNTDSLKSLNKQLLSRLSALKTELTASNETNESLRRTKECMSEELRKANDLVHSWIEKHDHLKQEMSQKIAEKMEAIDQIKFDSREAYTKLEESYKSKFIFFKVWK